MSKIRCKNIDIKFLAKFCGKQYCVEKFSRSLHYICVAT